MAAPGIFKDPGAIHQHDAPHPRTELTSSPAGRRHLPTLYSRRTWQEAHMNLVRWTEMPRGGHFAMLEQPELLVNDVRELFRDVHGASRAPQGKPDKKHNLAEDLECRKVIQDFH